MGNVSLEQRLTALASRQRLVILAELADGRLYVSELARRAGMSRALLYMHLAKLEEAELVSTSLELTSGGTAVKFVELQRFYLQIDIDDVVRAVGDPRFQRK